MQLATPSLLLFLIGIAFVAGSGVEDSKKHHPLAKHRQRQHNQQQIFVTAPPSTTQTPKDEPSLEEILSGSAVQSTQHTPTSGQLSQHRLYNNGRHVCTREETVTRPVRVVETYCKPTYKSQTQKCTNGTSLCTAFRVQYDTLYRTVIKYTTIVEKKNACCPGWIQKHQKANQGCLQAVCNPACLNGGSCVRPNVCSCPVGYTGPTCETDVDECAIRASNKCHQNCVNTIGSYECSCYEGFQLQDDRQSCKFRLDLVPELQALLTNYEAMSKRIAILEQESKERSLQQSLPAITMDAAEFESTVSNMTQHILTIEDKLNKLTETSMLTSRYNSIIEPDNDSLSSISEQLGILEERLADCTCTPTQDNRVKPRS